MNINNQHLSADVEFDKPGHGFRVGEMVSGTVGITAHCPIRIMDCAVTVGLVFEFLGSDSAGHVAGKVDDLDLPGFDPASERNTVGFADLSEDCCVFDERDSLAEGERVEFRFERVLDRQLGSSKGKILDVTSAVVVGVTTRGVDEPDDTRPLRGEGWISLDVLPVGGDEAENELADQERRFRKRVEDKLSQRSLLESLVRAIALLCAIGFGLWLFGGVVDQKWPGRGNQWLVVVIGFPAVFFLFPESYLMLFRIARRIWRGEALRQADRPSSFVQVVDGRDRVFYFLQLEKRDGLRLRLEHVERWNPRAEDREPLEHVEGIAVVPLESRQMGASRLVSGEVPPMDGQSWRAGVNGLGLFAGVRAVVETEDGRLVADSINDSP
ncbi:MAG: hypothetical protein Ct9H300mP1_36410 [Planctomycetaceae bacterium]|jgi:hypothetical protein|nr:MAG: hypothetical protein Ct9H300mP1_36410 [Planctomycetaceae bacterium]